MPIWWFVGASRSKQIQYGWWWCCQMTMIVSEWVMMMIMLFFLAEALNVCEYMYKCVWIGAAVSRSLQLQLFCCCFLVYFMCELGTSPHAAYWNITRGLMIRWSSSEIGGIYGCCVWFAQHHRTDRTTTGEVQKKNLLFTQFLWTLERERAGEGEKGICVWMARRWE